MRAALDAAAALAAPGGVARPRHRALSPAALDLVFALLSFALFTAYHAWYYSWHLWSREKQVEGQEQPADYEAPPLDHTAPLLAARPVAAAAPLPPPLHARHRLDMAGQAARTLFTQVSRQDRGCGLFVAHDLHQAGLRAFTHHRLPQAVLSTGSDADINAAAQFMRCEAAAERLHSSKHIARQLRSLFAACA